MEKNYGLRFKDKICLITGSTLGIGLAIATRFGEEGGTVIICSRHQTNIKSAEKSLKEKNISFVSYICNITSRDSRLKMLQAIKDKFGRIDVLVCNVAASVYFGPTSETHEEAYDKIMNTNVKATFFTIQDSLPLLKVSKNSKILIMSSVTAYYPVSIIGLYSITKTALVALTRVFSEELAKDGIRVNCIAPTFVKTRMAKAFENTKLATLNFQARIGETDEIGGIASFLCSDDSSFVTGEIVIASGGYHTRF